MQHRKTVGVVSIMCMARRAARRTASGTAATVEINGAQAALEGVAVSATTPSAGKAKKRQWGEKMTVDCADQQSQRQSEDIYSSFKDVYADEAIHELNIMYI